MKYYIGQVVFYIKDNVVHSAPILARMTVENNDIVCYNDIQRRTFQSFGDSCTVYATCHGVFNEDRVFSNKKSLTDSL